MSAEATGAALDASRLQRRSPRLAIAYCACAAGIILTVLLRVVALASDPYSRLDWSAGILTDEGFYIHNARNVALFGYPRTDQFNNMLLSPLLHYVQTAVFLILGTGSVQARSISVACSLLALCILFAAMRRAFGVRIALTAALFLGLDHTNLLYNRMALMDTPAALLAVAAFYAFVRATEDGRRKTDSADPSSVFRLPSLPWFLTCGILLGITVTSRMLCAYLIPAPFVALWLAKRFADREGILSAGSRITYHASLATATILVIGLYASLWYLPHQFEIAPMNRYYRVHQIQPSSGTHLFENIQHAFVGDFRGLSPYLFRHTPVLLALALLGIVGSLGRANRRGRWQAREPWVAGSFSPFPASGEKEPRGEGASRGEGLAAELYLVAWLLLGWLTLAVISYSPSRYYVTTYPAFASIAAIALWRHPEMGRYLTSNAFTARVTRTVLAGFLTFHGVLALIHYSGASASIAYRIALYGIPIAAAVAAAVSRRRPVALSPGHLVTLSITAWAIVNTLWLGDWLRHLAYTQRDMSVWLARNLPADSVLIGDVAPGVSLDNRFVAVHVQPGLCNDRAPVEAWPGRHCYIVILDGRWKERYWLERYPQLVEPERRIRLARVLRWDVGVYPVVAATEAGTAR